jgi:hypothetical protein
VEADNLTSPRSLNGGYIAHVVPKDDNHQPTSSSCKTIAICADVEIAEREVEVVVVQNVVLEIVTVDM